MIMPRNTGAQNRVLVPRTGSIHASHLGAYEMHPRIRVQGRPTAVTAQVGVPARPGRAGSFHDTQNPSSGTTGPAGQRRCQVQRASKAADGI